MAVDVIIPVYRGERVVERAVRSVLDQGESVTVFVVDDASPDGSADVIRRLAEGDPRVRPVTLATNGGVAHARNIGIAAGSAPLIAFLDQDDAWPSGSLAVRLAALDASPDAGYVTGRQRIVLDEGAERPSWVRPEWLDSPQAGIIPGALLARRPLFAEIGGFDEDLRYGGDDPDWFARARRAGIASVELDDVVLTRHVHGENRSAHPGTDADLLAVVRRHLGGAS